MRQVFSVFVLASAILGVVVNGGAQQSTVPDAPAPQPSVPSAPAPQAPSAAVSGTQVPADDSISDLAKEAAHGKAAAQEPAPAPPADAPTGNTSPDGPPQADAPYVPKNADEAEGFTIRQNVNFVSIPVTVLAKGQEVAGLTWRDFRVYENGKVQHIDFFSVDAAPLSVAFVIDQSLPRDIMGRVNTSLSAIGGAFTPQDEAAVFTYADGVTEQTTFTQATGDRLPAVLARARVTGADMGTPDLGGPMMAGPTINGKPIDPNLTPGRSNTGMITLPREVHTLNDAILAAGEALSKVPKGRRRVIYVISDGKESRSKAKAAEVIRYLQSHQETLYATLVGESAVPYIGYIDKFHIPLLPYDNILPKYTTQTGGLLEGELSTEGMERSFSHILDGVRTEYTLGYYTHGSTLDSRYRKLDIHVERPNLDVIAPPGYYPSAAMSTR